MTRLTRSARLAEIKRLQRDNEEIRAQVWADPDAKRRAIIDNMKRQVELAKKPGRKFPRFYIDSPEFGVAIHYVTNQIKYEEAVEALRNMRGLSDERQAERYLERMKPRAFQTARALKQLGALPPSTSLRKLYKT